MLDEDVRCKVDEDINYAVYYQKLPFFRQGLFGERGAQGDPGMRGERVSF